MSAASEDWQGGSPLSDDGLLSDWRRVGDAVRWRLAGRLDALVATRVRERLAAADLTGLDAVVLDLRGLDFVDSAGLAALVRVLRRCEADGVPLRVALPEGPDARRIFSLTQFDRVFAPALPDDLAPADGADGPGGPGGPGGPEA